MYIGCFTRHLIDFHGSERRRVKKVPTSECPPSSQCDSTVVAEKAETPAELLELSHFNHWVGLGAATKSSSSTDTKNLLSEKQYSRQVLPNPY